MDKDIKNLFEYLKEIYQLRTKVVTDYKKFDKAIDVADFIQKYEKTGETHGFTDGLDGDDEGYVYDNIKRIVQKEYDVAIIPLSRSVLHYPTQTIRYVWEKWIDRSIYNLANAKQPTVFPNHERYYVHTMIPQLSANPDYTGQIYTQEPSQAKMCDMVSDATRQCVKQLIEQIIQQ